MTKEQKILLLLIILVGGGGAVLYVNTNKTDAISNGNSQTVSEYESQSASAAIINTSNPTTLLERSALNSATTPNQQGMLVVKEYATEVGYSTPENGKEKIHVTISLAGGLIQDVAFAYDTPTKREAAYNLGNFEKALAAQGLVGTKLSDVSLSRVG